MLLKGFVKKNEKENILTLRKKLGCSQEQLARIIGIAVTTVSRWENNAHVPSALANKRIRDLEKIIHKMEGVIKKGKEAEWSNTPNEELNNDTPLEMILRGSEGIKKVLEVMQGIECGTPV